MESMIVLLFCLLTVAAAIPTMERWERAYQRKECRKAGNREKCSWMLVDILGGVPDMKSAFQNYCRKSQELVPCLERDKDIYRVLRGCVLQRYPTAMFEQMSFDEMWNTSIDFVQTVNDVVCTRTDEVINLIKCIKMKDAEPLLDRCVSEYMQTLLGRTSEQPITNEIICSSVAGFASCMKDEFIDMCGAQYTDLLDTVYDDAIVDALKDGLGCEVFARALRDLRRK